MKKAASDVDMTNKAMSVSDEVPLLNGKHIGLLLSTHSLVSGWSPMIPLVVHQPTYPSIWSAGSAHKSSGDNVVRMWVQLKRWCMSCV